MIQSLPHQATNAFFCDPFNAGSCIIVLEQNSQERAYCHSFSLVISVRSFITPLSLFPALTLLLSVRHFRSNEEVRRAVKNFLRSLGTDFYQDDFLKLTSRFDSVGGEYVGK
ncbi:hypothetical protein AVEN_24602-1 [Araneus ventricosus]|uniref:Uncharacterized protein n=1 Tax=Araneus ventricosus TaxID=182803 RepID=A0A4Y2X052_ARAVE|nr:hypothetical protein AVEN_24602-1 [Araneus ventricosus]